MKQSVRILAVAVVLAQFVFTTWAQERTWDEDRQGEIEDASFVVEKERQIELPVEARRFEKIPPLPDDVATRQVQPYSFSIFYPEMTNLAIRSRVLKLKDEPLEKLYGGNINVGIGNYLTPYLELDYFNKRENNYLLGVNAEHLSSANGPVDNKNSGNGYSRLKLFPNFSIMQSQAMFLPNTGIHFIIFTDIRKMNRSTGIRSEGNLIISP
jgi:hypothetical protein